MADRGGGSGRRRDRRLAHLHGTVATVRRTPLRRRRLMRRRREAPTWTFEQWERANARLFIRQHGRCYWCGKSLKENAVRHHRLRRRDGGDTYANVVLLHPDCHNHVHAHPEEARASGFIVPVGSSPQGTLITIRHRTGAMNAVWLRLDGTSEVA